MKPLTPEQLSTVLVLLRRATLIGDSVGARQALVLQTFGSDHPLVGRIAYDVSPLDTYLTLLVQALADYGDDTLVILLRACKARVGEDVRRAIEVCIADLYGGVVDLRTPVSAFNARAQTFAAPGGTVQLDSAFYLSRPHEENALVRFAAQDRAVITLRAPRQTGKSSLMAACLPVIARQSGVRPIFRDLQSLTSDDLANADALWRSIARPIARGAQIRDWRADWDDEDDPQFNMETLLTRVFEQNDTPLLLCLDETDRLMGHPRQNDFFPLVRAFYNAGASSDVWRRVRWLLCTSTEPALFIENTASSPFNIGEASRVPLSDFDPAQVANMAARHGFDVPESARLGTVLRDYLAGRPFLTHLWLYSRAAQGCAEADLMDAETMGGGVFRNHLERFLTVLRDDERLGPEKSLRLLETMRQILRVNEVVVGEGDRAAQRLEGAGLVCLTDGAYRPACSLYARYFRDRLR